MGFGLGSIGKAIGSVATAPLKAISMGADILQPKVDQPAAPPEINPGIKQNRDRMFELSQQFAAKRPELEKASLGAAEEDARLGLANKMYDVKTGANQRGMLYSGLRAKGEADAAQEAASGLAKKSGDIKRGFEQQQQALEDRAFGMGMQTQDLEQKRYDAMYNSQMAAKSEQAAINSSPLGIIGGFNRGAAGLLGQG